MAGVGFDPIPLRATHFKCMTDCKRTSANGYLAEEEDLKDLMGKGKKIPHVQRYFIQVKDPIEKQRSAASLLSCNAPFVSLRLLAFLISEQQVLS